MRSVFHKVDLRMNRPDPSTAVAVLQRLAQSYPQLFGPEPLPLKRGIYQDLLQAHAGDWDAADLKQALSRHTRSGHYLNAVAAGRPRHDLNGQVVEPMAPEHVLQALVEVFRRRQGRSREDLTPRLLRRLAQAYEASGCTPDAYVALAARQPEAVQALVERAMADVAARRARDEALARAHARSGLSAADFAEQYGVALADLNRALSRAEPQAQV